MLVLDADGSFHVAAFVLNVVFEFVPELLDIAANGHGRGIC